MPTRNVVITDHQATFVEQLVANGRYQNASEVLREGLRLVEQRETDHATKLKALRAAIQVGIDDIEAGRYTAFGSIDALADDFEEEAERVIREVESERNTRA
ncbi:type II toxin-antitoxin system ParD family antitoxin [Thermomonas sp.]|uniref:type II toxin-antitoxin system ParD family antitoxin n=1 Tax=Thermomonas sp. TaxID=1971895 RepID=UPI0035B0E1C5